jgi:hypothetical protein
MLTRYNVLENMELYHTAKSFITHCEAFDGTYQQCLNMVDNWQNIPNNITNEDIEKIKFIINSFWKHWKDEDKYINELIAKRLLS